MITQEQLNKAETELLAALQQTAEERLRLEGALWLVRSWKQDQGQKDAAPPEKDKA